MDRTPKIPVTRMNMWFDDADYDLEIDIAKEYLQNDSNVRVVLYRVDHANTNKDDVYGESDVNDIRFHPPVELVVSALRILPAEVQNYNPNGTMVRMDRGNLSFAVLSDTLKEQKVDIKRGDFIGYAFDETGLSFFEVRNDGRVNLDNQHSLYGTRPYFRSLLCVPVDPNQFKAL